MAAEMVRGRRRVFVEDARGNGQFLRVTWHGEPQQFVVSNWVDNVCVGATRVPAAHAADLIGVLVEGLTDVANRPPPEVTAPPQSLRAHLLEWWRGRRRALVSPASAGRRGQLRRSA